MKSLLTGSAQTVALSRTRKPIALEDAMGNLVGKFSDAKPVEESSVPILPLSELFTYLARGYEVYGSKRRVDSIRPPTPRVVAYVDRRPFPVDSSFQDGRACLKFWKDQRSDRSLVVYA